MLLADRGVHYLRAKRLGSAMAAWLRWVERRRADRAAEDKAVEHSRMVLRGGVLGALQWYVGYRESKSRDRDEAQEMFTRRLQREGVSQWLVVGMWRKTQRLKDLAEKKVGFCEYLFVLICMVILRMPPLMSSPPLLSL